MALVSIVLFFLRWCGIYWAIPSILTTRDRAGFLCGCMNLSANIAGITVPIIVGFIVQITGSYFLAMMFFAGAGIAAPDLFERDRLQPQAAGLRRFGDRGQPRARSKAGGTIVQLPTKLGQKPPPETCRSGKFRSRGTVKIETRIVALKPPVRAIVVV